ncbi:MAG: tRNA (adenosine(37)-N6)-threonylcarbamoyltransferase complex ATPase subunit type 1 TsaE [Candidatus Wallbacteria bacterium]|nr:tRNA (adenosine(37)-N6)-threonylcarbamoyltransferase complex ATPase subunit type 1 TsaE [Candidatus Wallbacteria bacterium]
MQPVNAKNFDARHFSSASAQETRFIAAELAKELTPGDLLLLSGDLGAGKTQFVKGLSEGLGIDPDSVTSPTFTLQHCYYGNGVRLFHLDFYRLRDEDLPTVFDWVEMAEGITAIEWADEWSARFTHRIFIDKGEGDSRIIRIEEPGYEHPGS